MVEKETKLYLKETHNYNDINFSFHGGNVRYSSKNKSKKNVFWIDIANDIRIQRNIYLILNDELDKKVIYLKLPSNIIDNEKFKLEKSSNKYRLEISNNKETFLIDIRSGGTKFDFKPYIIDEIYK